MQAISPNTGAPEELLDPEGKVFNPLPAALYQDADRPNITVVLTRWQPTPEERAAVAAGEDIYVAQLADDNTVSALKVTVGGRDYHVAARETVPTDSEGAE